MQALTRFWYRDSLSFLMLPLLPFSWLFHLCVKVRKSFYDFGIFKRYHFEVPVIVVGNITAGGTGKTPFVIWLANFLKTQGYRPGIVSRGVGGKKHKLPHWVDANDTAEVVGDEALLLMKNTACPVVLCKDRVAAVRTLLQGTKCNVVLSDDGLQHYRLGRALEIALIDGVRRFGNHCMLPAGPLREKPARLKTVDFVLENRDESLNDMSMVYQPSHLIALNKRVQIPMSDFSNKKVHAVAGIGHPQRFFDLLKKEGFECIVHVFPDHAHYQQQDFDFKDNLPIIMTEKDAVKCVHFAKENYWYLPITVKISLTFQNALLTKLKNVEKYQ